MRWDRLSLLIEKLEADLVKQGSAALSQAMHVLTRCLDRYFYLDSHKHDPVSIQMGTVRTNCMDNLDRTNVAQAAIAKWTLTRQLKELGILNDNDAVDNYEDLAKDFRESIYIHDIYIRVVAADISMQCGQITRTSFQ